MAWTDGVDRAPGVIVTDTMWNALLGATGSLMTLKVREVWASAHSFFDGANYQPLAFVGAPLTAQFHQGAAQLRVPDDYGSIVEAVMVVQPKATQAAANWDLTLTKFPIGGALSNQTDAATTYNVVNGQVFEVPFTALWAALAPGVGNVVRFDLTEATVGHDVDILGVFIRYNPA